MGNKIQITLMRHGRSCADDENVHEGRYDSPLTDIGRIEAQTRAKEFLSHSFYFDLIISSTLIRAQETAKIIGETLNIPIETDLDWMEIDNGPLAGLSFDDANKKYPIPDFRNPYEPFCGSGESDWEIYCRSAKAIENVIRRGFGSYLVVSHGGILNSALRTIFGSQIPVNRRGAWFSFGDTGYARLNYDPSEHIWRLLEFNPGV